MAKNPNNLLLGELSEKLSARMTTLDQHYQAGTLKHQEKFERLILHMIHPKVVDPRDTAYWYKQLKKLLS